MNDRTNRTVICSVAFLDIVDYSKRVGQDQVVMKERFNALISEVVKDIAPNDRVLIDTGDGAALCFMGDPEDALFVVMNLRDRLRTPECESIGLTVRIGINLGPVRMITDINGHQNVIGDGINVAQRVMSFAEPNQIMVSRTYFEVVSRLSQEYTQLFHYAGARTDKHVREHEVYKVGPGKDDPDDEFAAPSIAAPAPPPSVLPAEAARSAAMADPMAVTRSMAAAAIAAAAKPAAAPAPTPAGASMAMATPAAATMATATPVAESMPAATAPAATIPTATAAAATTAAATPGFATARAPADKRSADTRSAAATAAAVDAPAPKRSKSVVLGAIAAVVIAVIVFAAMQFKSEKPTVTSQTEAPASSSAAAPASAPDAAAPAAVPPAGTASTAKSDVDPAAATATAKTDATAKPPAAKSDADMKAATAKGKAPESTPANASPAVAASGQQPAKSDAAVPKTDARKDVAARQATKAAPAGPTGTLEFWINPWGDVSIDGKSIGTAPPLKVYELPAGTHRVEIFNDSAGFPYKETIEVKAGVVKRISFTFR